MSEPKTIYRKDYTPYRYTLNRVDLNFDLRDEHTIVTSRLTIVAKGNQVDPLFLHGEELELLSLSINDQAFDDYVLGDAGLHISSPPQGEFTLEIQTKIYPAQNTALEGLYMSGGNYCTQCEAEGFRRITYYPDRPDVLSIFTTRIEADQARYPVLLGNGNCVDKGTAENGRHYAVWEDPFPKPCYLFALVAGDLEHIHDTFKTQSERTVDLYIYVRKGDEGQCDHAMESLKKSMTWDEDVYGLEYDLDIFNIVAVSDFNMGAMENKSLNIFNTALVLAHQDTATDHDFIRVESVIAHEYFHNWSGNRVTCRDWFQLSLKEGLTVFRDQEFSSDINSRPVQRIDDVELLRNHQFPEDSGPLAHPIRPDEFIEINNFYTRTVYEKGAEVIRMMHTILGPENYRKGTDLYFSRHDGDAATCDDFVTCMSEASGVDLSHFKLWYEQAGTPLVDFAGTYSTDQKTYTVTLSQSVPDTPGQTHKKSMHIPVAVGLLGRDGKNLLPDPEGTVVLNLTEDKQSFTFEGIPESPVPSVLRNFSAPVKLSTDLSHADLTFLMIHDTDGFNRWEAAQTLAVRVIYGILDNQKDVHEAYLNAYGHLLSTALDPNTDKALLARSLTLPSVEFIGQSRALKDPVTLYNARDSLLRTIKRTHRGALDKAYDRNRSTGAFEVTPDAMGQRALQNVVLHLLTITGGTGCRRRAKAQYDEATNMTDRIAALSVLARIDCPESAEALSDFYNRFKDHKLVIDKWFAVQASAPRKDILNVLKSLRAHEDFNIKNPNRVRALYAAFAMNNPFGFHAADGSGYGVLTDAIIELNQINPQIASRLCGPFRSWRDYSLDRQDKMKGCLEKILDTENLSPNVFEIVSKSLK